MAAFRALNQVRRVFAELYETSEQAMSWAVSRVWPAKDLVVGMDNVFWSSAQDTGADSNQEWLHEPWQWKKQGVPAPFSQDSRAFGGSRGVFRASEGRER